MAAKTLSDSASITYAKITANFRLADTHFTTVMIGEQIAAHMRAHAPAPAA